MSRPPRAEATGERAAGRQRRLARILHAAEELFATHGFANTTVDEIAAAAGVSKGLVYDHYVSKEALLGAIWDQLVEDWTRAVSEGKFDENAIADSIGAMVHGSLEYVRTNPLLRRIIAPRPGLADPRRSQSQLGSGAATGGPGAVLAHVIRRGQLRRDLDVAHTAEVIWLLHFTLTRELFVGPQQTLRADSEELLRSAVELVVAGLRAPGGKKR